MLLVFCSSDAVQPAGEVQTSQNGVHQPAAPGARAPVQTQQVPLTTQTLRGGHVLDADGNTGNTVTPSSIIILCFHTLSSIMMLL